MISDAGETRALMHMVAKMHYEAELPQVQIARQLGVSTATISRLLQRARTEGIVRIEVRDLVVPDALGAGLERALGLRRVAVAFPGSEVLRFADLWLSRRDDGGTLVEVHPVDEFPGEDPAQLLPSALSAALKGLAHELRNPLAGVKGAAQLLARRAATREADDERELLALIDGEVARLTGLLDRLLNRAGEVSITRARIDADVRQMQRPAASHSPTANVIL